MRLIAEKSLKQLFVANSDRKIFFIVAGNVERQRELYLPKSYPGEVVVLDRKRICNLARATGLLAGVVVATNICEAGANHNPDMVIDTGDCFVPVIDGDHHTIQAKRAISEASQVQRAGRVGRRKSTVL